MLSYKKLIYGPLILLACTFTSVALYAQSAGSGYYYQIKIYHYKTAAQETTLDNYLKAAYLPSLHQKGFKNIGVFKPVETDTADRRIYVFVPFKKLEGDRNL